MVERTVGALLAHFNVVISTPPFMISWKRLCCSIYSVVCCSLMLSFHAVLLFIRVCLVYGSRCNLRAPSRHHPFLGYRHLSVCHARLLLFRISVLRFSL